MLAKTLILTMAAAFVMPSGTGGEAGAAAAQRERPAWDRQMSFVLTPSDGERAGRVNLSLRYGNGRSQSQYGNTMALADLVGVNAAELAAGGGPVQFRIAREAGTVACAGSSSGGGRATGTCRFEPDEGFAADLDRRGIGRPDAEEQFHLAMARVGRPLLDELARQDYPRPRVSDLVALGIHGADVDYLRELDASGYRVGSLTQLVAFRIHGVTPRYIGEMAALGQGYRNLPADQLVAMRIHGVTPAYVREMGEAGYRDLSVQQLLSLRIHGVRPEEARAINAAVAGDAR